MPEATMAVSALSARGGLGRVVDAQGIGLLLQGKSLPNELLDFFDHDDEVLPTPSALCQQRDKILKDCWEYLFHSFIEDCRQFNTRTYRGYRLCAIDGSDVNICRNVQDEETFIHQGKKGINQVHINALYDILNGTYIDVTFQGKKKLHEREAATQMVDRYNDPIPAIFVGDRGYESFNVFAHLLEARQKFVIRLKDIDSNGILGGRALPNSEFDLNITTTLTKRQTIETKENKFKQYTILNTDTDFDYLNDNCKYYDISFRIVRFKVGNEYVCVATNLPKDKFPLEEIKKIYNMRWGEETSFRELKYTIGLVNFHARKKELILQEIYARMIMYNFCEMVTHHVSVTKRRNTKHDYRINFSTAVNICRYYLAHGGSETMMVRLIRRFLTPIRKGRTYERDLQARRNRSFIYRAS